MHRFSDAQVDGLFRSAFEHAGVGMAITSLDGIWLRVNASFAASMRCSPEDLIGTVVADVTADAGARHDDAVARASITAGEHESVRATRRLLRRDGDDLWVEMSTSLVRLDGRPLCFVSQMVDVTDRRRDARALEAREAELRLVADNTLDFLSRLAPDGTYRYASPASRRLVGREPEALVGRPLLSTVLEQDRSLVADALMRLANGGSEFETVAFRALHADGSSPWFESTFRAVRHEDGALEEVVAVARDVTERKHAEQELTRQALHDALTGLPNRTLLLDRLALSLLRSLRSTGSVAVLFFDLDRFKVVNDSLGHEAGDRLLVQVAARLDATLRPADTVARFGGDEFVVLCDDVAGELEAVAIAQRVIELFEKPFDVDGHELYVGTSIGIALSRGRGARAEDLIRDADAAMYRAKERGRGRYELFDAAMRAHAVARLETESQLRRAIGAGELRLHFQPEISVVDGAVVGFEALVRWEHPERGLLPPAEFIPLAEESGLIVTLGAWVLHEACAEAARWRRDLGPRADRLVMSVNLSARQLAQPDLVTLVADALARTGTDPNQLCLEITESAVVESGPAAARTLQALKALGVRLAIDDFGTGYSSLGHLRRFPIDTLKLDRSFVSGLETQPEDASIARAVIGLAQALGLTTVAEGIETPAQLAMLADLGCELGQGFLFAKPEPAAIAEALVGSHLPA